MKTISILGSTGSIGTQALDIARLHKINIKALAANRNVSLLTKQAKEFNAEYVCIYDKEKYKELKENFIDTKVKVLCGMEGLCEIAVLDGVDILLNSVVGIVGLKPTLEAIE